ncbi:MAG: hypothetical protein M1828_000596 [Chrysothrix sp. TS-e1954]|nr:MAG: hypothetical protein M1828_000596 [Chrysothrix sp. TS-e1954]
MLDENLPTFFLADATDNIKHHSTYYLARKGLEPEPAYSLHHADPASPSSRNLYAVALFDPYNPDVLFGEVLVRPEWTQPSSSPEETRKNGGMPPPPEPVMPTEFTIQLYNPDQQIIVKREHGLLGAARYDFSLPQSSFRAPSGSALDKSRDDPGATSTTPRINFSWKRDSKLSKDMTCVVRGKSTDVINKKRSKEPDIIIGLLKSFKELTIYEPNLYRVEMEDVKGLELVLLLGSAVIRDVFYGSVRQVFNIGDSTRRGSAGSSSRRQNSPLGDDRRQSGPMMHAALGGLYPQASEPPQPSLPPRPQVQPSSRPPPADPRTQWEIDAETKRLKAQTDKERREQRRKDEQRKLERARADEEEGRRLRKILETEEKEKRRKQQEVDKETERLRKIYGQQQASGRLHTQSAPIGQGPFPIPPQNQSYYQQPQQFPQYLPQQYPQYPQASSSSSSGGAYLQPAGSNRPPGSSTTGKKRRSIWDMRTRSDVDEKLTKKSSSVF